MESKTRVSFRLVFVTALVLWFAGVRAHASFNAFFKFADPEGESTPPMGGSTDRQFPGTNGWFELISFDYGIMNTVAIDSASAGSGAGKAKFNDFHFTKEADSASPVLLTTLGEGNHFGHGA